MAIQSGVKILPLVLDNRCLVQIFRLALGKEVICDLLLNLLDEWHNSFQILMLAQLFFNGTLDDLVKKLELEGTCFDSIDTL